jgi:hypothetical protein
LLSQTVQAGPDGALIDAIGMPIQGMKPTKVFQKPEPAFHVKCDVHGWMSAYIATFAHPFFGVSNNQGTVELSNQ